MATFYQALMPSGFAIRLREYTTRHEITIADRIEKVRGGEALKNRETLFTLLDGYTNKLEIKRATVPVLNAKGEPLLDDAGVPVTREAIDVDATLAAVDAKAWLPCTYESLSVEGDGNFYKIFKNPLDYATALKVVSRSIGTGLEVELLEGKAQAVGGG